MTHFTNLLYIYETLCKHYSKAILDNDKKLQEKTAQIIKEYFINSQFGKLELETYKTISTINAKDSGIIKSLILESLSQIKKYSKKQSDLYYTMLNKRLSKDFDNSFYVFGKPSEISNIIKENIQLYRENENSQFSKKLFLENVDKIITHSLSNNNSASNNYSLSNASPVNSLVFKQAINIFNNQYNSQTLKDYELEMIQEFLHIKNKPILLEALKNRLKNIQKELKENKSEYKKKIKNFDELSYIINEYNSFLKTESNIDAINIEGVIKTLSDFYQITNSLKEI